MGDNDTVTVLETSRIPPDPAGTTIGQTSHPLSFFDLTWIASHPVQQLCFYEYPNYSKSHFIQTVVPTLKHSLSISLSHFLPLSGNLIVFPYSTGKKPEIRYVEGDSVSLLVAECTSDFEYLTGNHARNAHDFYPLVPHLGQISKSDDGSAAVKVPLLAVQVTLFPDSGVCIGITTHHAACDGNARVRFCKAWASFTKDSVKSIFLESTRALFDRSVIKDPFHLEETLWSSFGPSAYENAQPKPLSGPSNKVRATFVMTRTQINKLKETVLSRRPRQAHVSSFTVASGYVWTCLARLRAAMGGENKGENEPEQVLFTADYRARLDPPIPATYFGNCVWGIFRKVKRIELLGEDGFVNAAGAIGDAIHEKFSNKENIYGNEETWKELDLSLPTTFGVVGSPKFNTYGMDFGWGKPKKCEAISIDYNREQISLSESRDSEDDLEIGLCIPKTEMEAFATIFNDGLIKIT